MTGHRNGGAAVVETLAANGVDTIFGIPGTHNLELYRHLATAGIRAITPRHEQGAGYAAEAYARVSGPAGRRGHHQRPRPDQRDDRGGDRVWRVAADARAVLRHAHRHRGPRPRPAARGQEHQRAQWTSWCAGAAGWAAPTRPPRRSPRRSPPSPAVAPVPSTSRSRSTCWSRPGPASRGSCRKCRRHRLTPDAIRRAAELLAAGAQPMIIAGGGAVDAQAELTALAEALGAPVATTVQRQGRGRRGAPALGRARPSGCAPLQKAAADSDALLVVGTELGDSDLWAGQIRGQAVIRCDIDPAQLDKNCPADLTLLGDAATTLAAVLAALPRRSSRRRRPTRPRRCAPRAETRPARTPVPTPRSTPRCDAALPADAALTGDSSQVTYFGSVHFFDVPAPAPSSATRPASPPSATACPPASAPSIARPGAPVAVLLGDGALMFSVQD